MKNNRLRSARLFILICCCIFGLALNIKPVHKVVYLHHKAVVRAMEQQKTDDEPGDFIIWKSIPRYLLTFNR